MTLDALAARGRLISLLERYGALLTDHQRRVMDLYLRQDWSLSEIAALQETSRAAVHDLVRRAGAALEEYERRLELDGESERRREAVRAALVELAELRRRVARLESALQGLA